MFLKFEQNYYVSQQYSFTFCATAHNLLDYTAGVACCLHDWKQFRKNNYALLYFDHNKTSCENNGDYFPPAKLTSLIKTQPKKWTNVVLLIEPIYRFVSAYYKLCVNTGRTCYSCETINCMLKVLLERMTDIGKGATPTKMDMRFIPQNWKCNNLPDTQQSVNVVLDPWTKEKRDVFIHNLINVLYANQVASKTVNNIVQESSEYFNDKFLTREYFYLVEEIRQPENMRLFNQLYGNDYKLFFFE
ncbi:unnamed protein product [Bursaphelenchus okinawaensis]|uniref:Uncharacterized protein n=1 Tax=Bursaphelenchus okinawaensis TaxID=465554 RepID=A0A811KZM4_9BILA|nr:unnamed protein product [Bursaphelenchus okinawaensis]CAG9114938.1 unnamed protein product [Bursaphelenchus okinawaensis]